MDIRNIFQGNNYLRAADLKGKQFRLQIAGCDIRNMAPMGKEEDLKPVLSFVQSDREFACNKTNSLKIAETLTSETDNWVGATVTLAPSITSFNGAEVPCIRIVSATGNGNGEAPVATQPPAAMPTHDPTNGEVADEVIPF